MDKVDNIQHHEDEKGYWRSLEQRQGSAEALAFAEAEFPQPVQSQEMSRRSFLKLMGASLAFAGLASCRRPVEKIVPYVQSPEGRLPGKPVYYATSALIAGESQGLLVESHDGRPTKIEGNALHPSSLGRSSTFMQAELVQLYDPDRGRAPRHNGSPQSWEAFTQYWRPLRKKLAARQGHGVAVLAAPTASPTLDGLIQQWQAMMPRGSWITYAPCGSRNRQQAHAAAGVGELHQRYDLSKANTIVSFDADLLFDDGNSVTNAADFMSGRRNPETKGMNRLYVIESRHSLTGSMADHRLATKNRMVGITLLALAHQLREFGVTLRLSQSRPTLAADQQKFVRAVANDLLANRGQSLIAVGERQEAGFHLLAAQINAALGNESRTINYYKASSSNELSDQLADFKELVTQIEKGGVDTLILLGGNPAYDLPGDLDFGSALKKVANVIRLSPYYDETAKAAQWYLPQSHFLESWGDVRSIDGRVAITQPLIQPLHKTQSVVAFMSLLVEGTNKGQPSGYDLVQARWRRLLGPNNFEARWRKALHDGIGPGKPSQPLKPRWRFSALDSLLTAARLAPTSTNDIEVTLYPSYSVLDGRYANNGWLQEMPDPITKMAWDNVAAISEATARRLKLRNGQIASFEADGAKVVSPVWIVPGHADNAISLELGFGRSAAGQHGTAVGFDVYPLRTTRHEARHDSVKVTATASMHTMATTQDHGSMAGRPLVREATLNEFRANPKFAQQAVQHPPLKSLWSEHNYGEGYQWGMVIDLNACTGCNACVVGCQSENNISVVGKEQVHRGREMQWIRIDRYFEGESATAKIVHQPVTCHHCENAPCEQVCPVNATVHDKEGLNAMVYNRCIGTRYCSNNCPYKVRRFNFFNYTNDTLELFKMANNPDVTIRFRGVMEKCTFCVQRINAGKIHAKKEGRQLRDGEVQTACEQACPTNAIVFGNINDPKSRVAQLKTTDRDYVMLSELNAKPRLSYLAKLRNPNPELAGTEGAKG